MAPERLGGPSEGSGAIVNFSSSVVKLAQPAYAPYAATKGAVEAIGLNRAALPHLRRQGHGLLLWVGSTSTRVGTPPYLAPYFAAMDSFVLWDDPVRTPR